MTAKTGKINENYIDERQMTWRLEVRTLCSHRMNEAIL